MKTMYPDYTNCIANLGCSILKYYGITPPNSTLAVSAQQSDCSGGKNEFSENKSRQ